MQQSSSICQARVRSRHVCYARAGYLPVSAKACYRHACRSKACYRHACRSKACYRHACRSKACYRHACRSKACYSHACCSKACSRHAVHARVCSRHAVNARVCSRHAVHARVCSRHAVHARVCSRHAVHARACPRHAGLSRACSAMAPCSACSAMAPCSAIAPCSRPTFSLCSRSCSPSPAWPSIPPPGLRLFRLHSTTLLDFLDSVFVLFGRQEPPLEGGKCKVCFGFCFMFLFFMSFILYLVMVLVCVLLPLPSCLFAIGSLVHCVMFSLVCSCHVTHSVCISSYVIVLFRVVYKCCNLLLVSLVRSCFVKSVSSQVCCKSSLRLFGFHDVNELHLGSSLRSPSVDSLHRCSLSVI